MIRIGWWWRLRNYIDMPASVREFKTVDGRLYVVLANGQWWRLLKCGPVFVALNTPWMPR